MAVWKDDELRREEVRGVFVIGVLALLFGFYQTDAVKSLFSSASPVNAVILNTITAMLVTFWGLYIVLTAVSMLAWNPGTKLAAVLRGVKDGAQTMFLIGIVETFVILAILGPIAYYQSVLQNPSYFEIYLAAGIVIFVGLGLALGVSRWRRRK